MIQYDIMKTYKPCIAIVMYRPIETIPPVMSLLVTLRELGENVHFITTESHVAHEFCRKLDIPASYLPRPLSIYANHATMNTPLNKIRRALGFIPQRIRILSALRKLKKQYGDVIVWGQEMSSTAIIGNLGMKLFPKQVTTLFELYDNYGSNWIGFNTNRAYEQSVLVHCEPNRARIHSEYHHLNKPTFVIANKPVMHPRKRLQNVDSNIQEVFNKIGDKPIFLYQGIWGKDRQDVATIMETIAKHRPNYAVLSMPATDEVKALLAPYPNAFTLPRIPAPHHLDITSHASVGVAVYKKPVNPQTLNDFNEYYCAPSN